MAHWYQLSDFLRKFKSILYWKFKRIKDVCTMTLLRIDFLAKYSMFANKNILLKTCLSWNLKHMTHDILAWRPCYFFFYGSDEELAWFHLAVWISHFQMTAEKRTNQIRVYISLVLLTKIKL